MHYYFIVNFITLLGSNLHFNTYRVTQNLSFNANKFQFKKVQFWNCLSEINISIAYLFGKLCDLKYLSRVFFYTCFLIFKRCLKIALNQKILEIWQDHLKSGFEIILTQKRYSIFFSNHKMGILDMYFLVKSIFILF